MGSVLKSMAQKRRRGMSYSLRKQRKWHLITDTSSVPASNPLGKAQKVAQGRFCHYDATAIIIP